MDDDEYEENVVYIYSEYSEYSEAAFDYVGIETCSLNDWDEWCRKHGFQMLKGAANNVICVLSSISLRV